eukprot:m.87868 g.87868  ORF g.87868 m.87868 type:complete len:175 (-) comp14795_c0_seq2:35-559(-)
MAGYSTMDTRITHNTACITLPVNHSMPEVQVLLLPAMTSQRNSRTSISSQRRQAVTICNQLGVLRSQGYLLTRAFNWNTELLRCHIMADQDPPTTSLLAHSLLLIVPLLTIPLGTHQQSNCKLGVVWSMDTAHDMVIVCHLDHLRDAKRPCMTDPGNPRRCGAIRWIFYVTNWS